MFAAGIRNGEGYNSECEKGAQKDKTKHLGELPLSGVVGGAFQAPRGEKHEGEMKVKAVKKQCRKWKDCAGRVLEAIRGGLSVDVTGRGAGGGVVQK